MTMGIYQITNHINGKFYIGSAINISKRWYMHKNHFKRNTHHNKHFQNAWNKYGEEAFECIVLELVKEKEQLIIIEQKWIDFTKCYNRKIGYNLCKLASSALGVKRSQATKDKLSKINTGKFLSQKTIDKIIISHLRLVKLGRKPVNRNIDKWPHKRGAKCKCEECSNKRKAYFKNYDLVRRKPK